MYNPVHKSNRYIHVRNSRKRLWSETHKSSVLVLVSGRRGLVRGELLIVVMGFFVGERERVVSGLVSLLACFLLTCDGVDSENENKIMATDNGPSAQMNTYFAIENNSA